MITGSLLPSDLTVDPGLRQPADERGAQQKVIEA